MQGLKAEEKVNGWYRGLHQGKIHSRHVRRGHDLLRPLEGVVNLSSEHCDHPRDVAFGADGRARIRVDWEGTETPADTLFLKLPPTDETSRQMVLATGMGRREARFYAHVAEHVPVRVPRPVFADTNEDGSSYLMVLEDLEAAGCSLPSNDEFEILPNARSMMRSLGRRHAVYAETSGQRPELQFVDGPMKSEWGVILVKSALDQFETDMPPEFAQLARLYLESNEAFQAVLEDGEKTLLHGDIHQGNLFIDGGEVGYLDWACTCRSVGMRDVAYFFCASLPTELRRSHEAELLEIYRASLNDNGAPRDTEELRDHYRRYAAYGWIGAVTRLAGGLPHRPTRRSATLVRWSFFATGSRQEAIFQHSVGSTPGFL